MKTTIIIPSLNPDTKLEQVVVGLVEAGYDDIVIVNDGSDEVGELLNSTPFMKDEEGYQDIEDNLFIEYCLNFLTKTYSLVVLWTC